MKKHVCEREKPFQHQKVQIRQRNQGKEATLPAVVQGKGLFPTGILLAGADDGAEGDD